MPVPILQRQRALAAIGEVRIGAQKTSPRAPGRKLETFRLTSQQKELIEGAAHLYGGEVSEWQSPVGPSWQVVTKRADLPIMVVVGYSLTLLYELWEGSANCVRRCDGEMEQLTDSPCICNAEGEDKCDIITRFMMLLPELGTSLGWRFRSTGEFAANELSGGVQIANELARGRVFVPATLRLTQRRSVGSGQVHRYAVPVLDFDPRMEARQLTPVDGELPELEPARNYTPVLEPAEKGVGIKEGIEAANRQEVQRNARSAAPIPDDEFDEGAPVTAPVPDEPEVGINTPGSTSESVTEQASGSEPVPEGTVPTGTDPFEGLEQGAAGPALGDAEPAADGKVPTPPEPVEPVYITDAQVRKFHAVRRKHVVLEGRAKEILQEVTGQTSSKKIPAHLFSEVLAKLEADDTGQGQLV